MPQRSILLVSQVGPPEGFSAARRIGGLTKYLSRAGHEVTVLTSRAFGSGQVAGAARTVRTRDLVATRVNPRLGRFEAIRDGAAEQAEGDYAGGHSPIAYAIVPDLSLVGWLPFALPRALGLARERRFDCVVTSSPPESGHLIGWALHRRGTPWIADFRDGWAFESTHPNWPLPLQHRLDAALERMVAGAADLVTAVTDPITEHLLQAGARAITLTNGFDPEEAGTTASPDELLSEERHSLVHTGRMAFSGRSPAPLIEAAARLDSESPELAARLEIAFAGPLSSEERASIERPTEHVRLRALGTLDHDHALALQRAADGLVLITGGERRSEATAKLYEYLAAGRPILVLGEASAAADIVRSAGAGIATSATDPGPIAGALRALLGGAGAPGNGKALETAAERFSYPRLASQLSDHIERIVASSHPERGRAR